MYILLLILNHYEKINLYTLKESTIIYWFNESQSISVFAESDYPSQRISLIGYKWNEIVTYFYI